MTTKAGVSGRGRRQPRTTNGTEDSAVWRADPTVRRPTSPSPPARRTPRSWDEKGRVGDSLRFQTNNWSARKTWKMWMRFSAKINAGFPGVEQLLVRNGLPGPIESSIPSGRRHRRRRRSPSFIAVFRERRRPTRSAIAGVGFRPLFERRCDVGARGQSDRHEPADCHRRRR